MATLSHDEIDRRLEVAQRLDARRRRHPEAVHVSRISRSGAVRRPAGARAPRPPIIIPTSSINYKRVTLTYSTHSEGGLTEKDSTARPMADRLV